MLSINIFLSYIRKYDQVNLLQNFKCVCIFYINYMTYIFIFIYTSLRHYLYQNIDGIVDIIL